MEIVNIEEKKELMKKKLKLLTAKERNKEKIEELNNIIDHHIWTYSWYEFQKECYEENIFSYQRLLSMQKQYSLYTFNFFTRENYYLKKIASIEKKINEIDKIEKSLNNSIKIKKTQRDYLIKENDEIDGYLEEINNVIECDQNDKKDKRKVL